MGTTELSESPANDNPVIVVWEPQSGPQTALITCPVFEVFYGGARGGGKTDGMLGEWINHADIYGADATGLMVRRERTQLIETIERSKEFYGLLGAKYHEQDKMWRFPNGARLRFAYLERDADAEGYQGHSYTRVYVEELGNFPSPKPVMKLMATLRSAKGIPVGFRATGNPGGPGHSWVKARYIDPAPGGWERLVDDRSGLERIYIPSRISDNQYLGDDYIARLRQSGSDELVKAWLDGDWSAIEGAFFDCWSSAKHVVRPFQVPAHWARFRSMDWGSAAPFSVGWWAIATENMTVSTESTYSPGDFDHSDGISQPRVIPRGCIVRYREWYGEGLKLTAEEVARGIVEREVAAGEEPDSNNAKEGKPHIAYGVLDPSAFAQDGGPSIAERMAREGAFFRRADNKRVPAAGAQGGWDQMRARMKGDSDGRPMLVVFDTCRDFIRTVPILQHDDTRPEDLDTEAEDHAADEARYACMSRPYIREAPVDKKPTFVFEAQPDGSVRSGLTMNELIKRNTKLRKERSR